MTDARDFDLELDMLSAYLDGELIADERAMVDVRLSESPEWRAELAEVQSARSIVRALGAREAPAEFWDRVVEYVESADHADNAPATTAEVAAPVPIGAARGTQRGERVSPGGRAVRRLAGAAAAVVALVVVVALPDDSTVKPNVTAVATQHGANATESSDPISGLAGVGPLLGFRK